GASKYGLWLIISAIPSYLALADFGFSAAATNDMTLAVACGAREEALEVFQSLLALNRIISISLVLIVAIIVFFLPARFIPSNDLVPAAEVRLVLILLSGQVAASLGCGVLAGAFQASGLYSVGNALGSTARLLETAGLVAGALYYRDFVPAAESMLAMRVVSLAAMALILQHA